MLTAKSNSIAATQSGVEQHGEPHALPCAERPSCLIGCDVVLGPNRESFAGIQPRISDCRSRVCFHKASVRRPLKKSAHGVEEMARLKRRLGASITSGADRCLSDPRIWRIASRGDNLLENILTLFARRQRKSGPVRTVAIAHDQPCERANARCAMLRAWVSR